MAWQQTEMFPSFRANIPQRMRFIAYLFLIACFQFSCGIYFCAMPQMVGMLPLTHADAAMLGCSMLAGITMYFPLAFRLKFRFTNKACLAASAAALAAINLVVPMVQSMPVLMVLCFAGGFFRLFGTFECLSNILPKIAPTYNYAVFLSFVFFVVLGAVHVFDIIQVRILYHFNWHYIHYAAIGVLLFALLLIVLMMRHHRAMPLQPLYGIDFIGLVLWSVCLLSVVFILTYGSQMEWFASAYIRTAAASACIALAMNIYRIAHHRHPYLDVSAWRTRNLVNLLLLFLFLDVLLASQQVLQRTFTTAILHLDSLHTADLYWWEIAGMLGGAVFSWQALTRLRWSHKAVCFAGMIMLAAYLVQMYFVVSTTASAADLYLPIACCGAGHVVVFIALTVYAQATASFRYYFQVLCILGLVRTGVGAPLGDAIYERALHAEMSIHSSLVLALRELYGWSIVFAVVVLVLIVASRFKRRAAALLPTPQRMYWVMFRRGE